MLGHSKMVDKLKTKDSEEYGFLRPSLLTLDDDWLEQPKLFHKWSSRQDKADSKVEEAKRILDIISAELDYKVRMHPKQFKLPVRPPEKMISNTIVRQPKYQKALTKLNKRIYKAKLLKTVVGAIHHRKAALENLVTLQGRDYFAEPKYPEGDTGRRARDRMENRTFRHKEKR